jgi:Zn-dependent M16 (insulinase) family peptidase
VAWRGPKALDQRELTALALLCEYLTDSALSPLQKEFVESEDPLASDV